MAHPPYSIIIVDDHKLLNDALVERLDGVSDVRCLGTALAARDGLELAKRTRPDVAVVDISLPEISGYDLLVELERHVPETRSLVLSMHDSVPNVVRALRVGAYGYVDKGTGIEELVVAIRQVAQGRYHVSEGLLGGHTLDKLLEQARAAPGADPEYPLTKRQRMVLKQIVEGASTRDIAENLSLSEKTVEAHRARLMRAVGAGNVAELVRIAVNNQLVV